MDAFESIISRLLWEDGYWTSIGYKINLSKEKKVELGKPSYPRPEIDILAYKASENRLLWVECKSFLDSYGVRYRSLTGEDERGSKLYKIFTWEKYRDIVTKELLKQVTDFGLTKPNPKINYCLAAGKIYNQNERDNLHKLFNERGWILYDEYWIKEKIEKLADKGYENDVAVFVAKLFSRVK